jgi:hypothetical protein
MTSTLQDHGVIPGFRSGSFDIWGVGLTADPDRDIIFVQGGESNRQIYVYDAADDAWTVTPTSVYDGGWGASLEYVAGTQRLYQIDGRNATNAPQGTAVLMRGEGDLDGDGVVGVSDLLDLLATWGPCDDPCCPTDLDESGTTDVSDLLRLLAHWT